MRASVGESRALPLHARHALPCCPATPSNIHTPPRAPVPSSACWARGSSHGWRRSWGGPRSVSRSRRGRQRRLRPRGPCRLRTCPRRRVRTVRATPRMARLLEQPPPRSPLRLWPHRRRPRHRPHISTTNQPSSVVQTWSSAAAYQNQLRYQWWYVRLRLLDHDVGSGPTLGWGRPHPAGDGLRT